MPQEKNETGGRAEEITERIGLMKKNENGGKEYKEFIEAKKENDEKLAKRNRKG